MPLLLLVVEAIPLLAVLASAWIVIVLAIVSKRFRAYLRREFGI